MYGLKPVPFKHIALLCVRKVNLNKCSLNIGLGRHTTVGSVCEGEQAPPMGKKLPSMSINSSGKGLNALTRILEPMGSARYQP